MFPRSRPAALGARARLPGHHRHGIAVVAPAEAPRGGGDLDRSRTEGREAVGG